MTIPTSSTPGIPGITIPANPTAITISANSTRTFKDYG